MKPLTKPQAMKWINALRSGEYKQTKYKLQDESGFCCLGVLCESIDKSKRLAESGFLYGRSLKGQNLSFSNLSGVYLFDKNSVSICLGNLNDTGAVNVNHDDDEFLEPFTFDEIADIIQAVIIEEVTL